ncbi:hypothetical protein [Mesorhizobium sp.]|uniref:hypothetical protein n=1 Tax=Mesorhizobium sp. TaxID=1871066 RepID=UPI000FE54752|nr:hypothetical protein [Mesorhizobium sp.]RWP96670.1 MAG: hypothetical protein EOR89_23255 [Mesorhizobium sp.]
MLQAEYPGDYRDKLLRTLQRRLKVWRSEQADVLLLGPLNKEPPILEIAGPHWEAGRCETPAISAPGLLSPKQEQNG